MEIFQNHTMWLQEINASSPADVFFTAIGKRGLIAPIHAHLLLTAFHFHTGIFNPLFCSQAGFVCKCLCSESHVSGMGLKKASTPITVFYR